MADQIARDDRSSLMATQHKCSAREGPVCYGPWEGHSHWVAARAAAAAISSLHRARAETSRYSNSCHRLRRNYSGLSQSPATTTDPALDQFARFLIRLVGAGLIQLELCGRLAEVYLCRCDGEKPTDHSVVSKAARRHSTSLLKWSANRRTIRQHGTDVRTIRLLPGHRTLVTTAPILRVATKERVFLSSPLDLLPHPI